MRIIESKMIEAVKAGKAFSLTNTSVYPIETGMGISLHGNPIAKIDDQGAVTVDLNTLRNWPTNTTKSRLRALGVNIQTKKGLIYIDGKKI